MSGADAAYGATRCLPPMFSQWRCLCYQVPLVLPAPYALSGTDLRYAATQALRPALHLILILAGLAP
eukprot:1391152-Rhodomonas_salina.1